MGLVVLAVFILCGIYVQNRGVVQHGKLLRKVTDHANLMGPINCIFYLFSSVKNTPFLKVNDFPELKVIDDNWEMIRDEALSLNEAAQIKASEDLDDLGFNSFFRTGWKRFYLKWYGGTNLKSAQQLCPKTVALLSGIPSVKAAVFTMLPPGSRLGEHRDPYAGSLRYHLGLVTPNSEDCNIVVDGQKYYWKDGESVMFDETFLHHAENNTDKNRIILFLDVKRPVRFFLVDWFNNVLSYTLMAASATKNVKGDKVGIINKAFHYLFRVRNWVRQLKGINKPLYNLVQYGFYAALIYLIFF
ncbi:MAG: aspartyl/asparaginyl beta-hydroxylase domain-containing protein [Pseudomonadota bacterium]|uniref:aspartyl/asparaginyl beta-hydroxylase domain-containing protein n=1 Tax=Gallaecimonas pentaromativorans TaxID=584787 RepID=UPI00067F3F11|nr:aspartyl/asparaginyl beta-hydroxylase domain-containing protein [Gallaecimonas pentaromativorans]MED5523775.1 aspartyl/asparaginyl beta-hydroxylase domain-containing protein [Pseudomonadota bacterium]